MKILEGGYVPLVIAARRGFIMWTWVRGTALLARKDAQSEIPLEDLLPTLERKMPPGIPGTAVYPHRAPGFRAGRADAQPEAFQVAA